MKSRLKQHLSITKKEWNGMVVLLVIIAMVLAAPYVFQYYHKDSAINFKDFDKAAALLHGFEANSNLSEEKIANLVYFKFDPNNLPEEQWHKLGLSERQVSIIKNYEDKGGRFYNKTDVKKIYSITADDYKRLAPYINLPEGEFISNKNRPGEMVELNTADSARLTRIHGVGPAFAQRILEYRQRLGGFLDKEQLKDIYGIDEGKYATIKNEVKINPARITKIKINEVDFEGLRKFPYLTNKQTNAIIQYRTQHGNYHSVDDMREIAILDEQILRKIAPYLSFNDRTAN